MKMVGGGLLIEVMELLGQIEEDTSVPRNVKFRVKNALIALQGKQRSLAVRIDASIQELDECCDDPNLPSYARMQIWDVVSKLETI